MGMRWNCILFWNVALWISCVSSGPVKREAEAPGTVIAVTSAHALDEIVNNSNSKLVILKVETKGCGGCVYIEPGYAFLANKYKQAVFLKADYMLVPECIWRFKIKQVPTFIFYFNGQVLELYSTTVYTELETRIIERLKV